MFNFSLTPLPIFKAIGEGFKLFSHTFAKIWYWSFLFHIINSLPNLLLFFAGSNTFQTLPRPYGVAYFFIFIIIFIIQVYGTIFLMHRIYILGAAPTQPTSDSFKTAKEKLLPAIVASVICFVGMMVLGLIAKVLNLSGPLIFLLFTPLVLFLLVLLLFYLPLIIFDNLSGLDALEKSIRLVLGYWWETLLVVLTPSFISLLLIVFAFMIQPPNSLGLILSMMVISSFIAPLTYSLLLTQYNNLRLLKKQKGLLD